MKKTIAALAVLSVLMTACQPKNTADGTSGSPSPTSPGSQAVTSPSPPQSPSPSPSPSPTPAVEAKTYKMNKNYDIVPIQTDGNKKVVLLTFDDGPKEKENIDKMIDVLDKHKAKAIFFVNGYRIKPHPELLKLIDDRGQIIGNHTYSHIVLNKESKEKIDYEIDEVSKQIKEITGKEPVFLRAPNGAGNDYIHEKAKAQNMLYMTWSDGSLDWDLPKDTKDKPQAVIDNVLKLLHPGANILMHELPWTVEALDKLLTTLEEKGYSFVDPRSIDTTLVP